ncbi:hypothetical protein [Capsulimonas corticalis]|nr:hypothetical protein [Capsulimonas corticalis]
MKSKSMIADLAKWGGKVVACAAGLMAADAVGLRNHRWNHGPSLHGFEMSLLAGVAIVCLVEMVSAAAKIVGGFGDKS